MYDCDILHSKYIFNRELNNLRKIICLRKSGVYVEGISVCNATEKLTEYGIHCLPYFGTTIFPRI